MLVKPEKENSTDDPSEIVLAQFRGASSRQNTDATTKPQFGQPRQPQNVCPCHQKGCLFRNSKTQGKDPDRMGYEWSLGSPLEPGNPRGFIS
jgi:hypothetical protein